MLTFDFPVNVDPALPSLEERKVELDHAITTVLHYLVPDMDRRGAPRRSGTDRRDAQSDALYADRRSGRERRNSSDRRLPAPERLLLLRQELQDVIRRQAALAP